MTDGPSAAQNLRDQRLARTMDREIAPVWHDRFARLIFRELPVRSKAIVLDVHCGPGHITAELLQRLDNTSRIVALDDDAAMLALARARVRPEWRQRVYFKPGDVDDITEMGDATYDLTIANLVLGERVHDWRAALRELVRVTKAGGQVLATLPLHGTWNEVDDLFHEVLIDANMREAVATLQKLRRMRPKPAAVAQAVESLGFTEDDFVFEHEHFELLFRSGREFLFSPVVDHGPLRLWKAILGKAEKPQALFWRFKEAIDTYYSGHVLAVGVHAGLIRLRVPHEGARSFSASYWSRYPELARIWGHSVDPGARTDDELESDMDMDIDLEGEDDETTEVDRPTTRTPTSSLPRPSQPERGETTTHEFAPDPGDSEASRNLAAMFDDDAIKELEALEDTDLDSIDEDAILESFEEEDEDEDLATAFGEVLLPEPAPAPAPKRTVSATPSATPGATKSAPSGPAVAATPPVARQTPASARTGGASAPAKPVARVPTPAPPGGAETRRAPPPAVPPPATPATPASPASKSGPNPAARAMAKLQQRGGGGGTTDAIPAPPIPARANVPAPPIPPAKTRDEGKRSVDDSASHPKLPPPPPTGPHKKPTL